MQSLRVFWNYSWIQAEEWLFNNKKAHRLTKKKTEKRHGMPFIFYLSSTNPKNLPKSDRSSSLTQRGPPSFQPFLSFDATTQPHFGMPSFGLSVTFVWCAVTWLTRTVLMLVALASAFSPAGGFFRQSPTFPTDLPTKVIDFCPVNRTFFWQRALVTHNDGSNENWPLCGGNDPRGDPFFTEEWIDQRELYSFTWTWFLSKRCTTFLYKRVNYVISGVLCTICLRLPWPMVPSFHPVFNNLKRLACVADVVSQLVGRYSELNCLEKISLSDSKWGVGPIRYKVKSQHRITWVFL